jgi:hypothetical protein
MVKSTSTQTHFFSKKFRVKIEKFLLNWL